MGEGVAHLSVTRPLITNTVGFVSIQSHIHCIHVIHEPRCVHTNKNRSVWTSSISSLSLKHTHYSSLSPVA